MDVTLPSGDSGSWLVNLARSHAPFIYNHIIELLVAAIGLFVLKRLRRNNTPTASAIENSKRNTTSDVTSGSVDNSDESMISDSEGYVLGTGTYSNIWNEQVGMRC